jgi:hypothetical protein
VIGDILWFVPLGASVAIEILARLVPERFAALTDLASRVASGRLGPLLLILFWAFVGVHLFARYTIPHV